MDPTDFFLLPTIAPAEEFLPNPLYLSPLRLDFELTDPSGLEVFEVFEKKRDFRLFRPFPGDRRGVAAPLLLFVYTDADDGPPR